MNSGSRVPESDGNQVRDVTLLPGETITYIFSPELGLTQAPPPTGQVLIATNQRVLAFCRNDGRDETFLTPVEELKGVAVKSGSRNTISILQGIVLAVGGGPPLPGRCLLVDRPVRWPQCAVNQYRRWATAGLIGGIGNGGVDGQSLRFQAGRLGYIPGQQLEFRVPLPGRPSQPRNIPSGEQLICGPPLR